MFTPPKATSDGSRPKVTVTELVAPWEAFETDTPTFVTCFGIPLPVEPSVLIPRIWFTFVFDTTPWSVWVRLKDFPTLLLLIIWGDFPWSKKWGGGTAPFLTLIVPTRAPRYLPRLAIGLASLTIGFETDLPAPTTSGWPLS